MNTEAPAQRRVGPQAPPPTATAAETDKQDSAPPARAEEDPRTRAARRAAELREHQGSLDEGIDKFYIDPRVIPDGWSYEWKTQEVLGKPNPSYEVALANRGWEAVPAARHPEMMPKSWTGNSILREGMILMERPLEITEEVKAADHRRAVGQVRAKEEQLNAAPPGTFEREHKGRSLASIKKSREATIPIPEK